MDDETALAGMPRLVYTRSVSRYGLSQVTAIFEDGTDIYFARQLVNEGVISEEESKEVVAAFRAHLEEGRSRYDPGRHGDRADDGLCQCGQFGCAAGWEQPCGTWSGYPVPVLGLPGRGWAGESVGCARKKDKDLT